jgi:hypothetical protein
LFSVAESSHDVTCMVSKGSREELFHTYRKSTSKSERVFFGFGFGAGEECSGLFM